MPYLAHAAAPAPCKQLLFRLCLLRVRLLQVLAVFHRVGQLCLLVT